MGSNLRRVVDIGTVGDSGSLLLRYVRRVGIRAGDAKSNRKSTKAIAAYSLTPTHLGDHVKWWLISSATESAHGWRRVNDEDHPVALVHEPNLRPRAAGGWAVGWVGRYVGR